MSSRLNRKFKPAENNRKFSYQDIRIKGNLTLEIFLWLVIKVPLPWTIREKNVTDSVLFGSCGNENFWINYDYLIDFGAGNTN